MELGKALVGLLFAAFIAVPLLLIYQHKRKQQQQLYAELNKIAKANGVKLGKVEYGLNYAIGLDINEEFVLFSKRIDGIFQKKIVRLSNLRYVHMNKVTYPNGGGSDFKIRKVELAFQPKDYSKPTHVFNFFDEKEDQLSTELEHAKKWEAKLGKYVLF